MSRVLTDTEIAELLAERKPLPPNWHARLAVRQKAGQVFKQRELDVQGDNGHAFRIILRQNELNVLDFSIVLVFVDVDGTDYRLIRFNGRHPSQHTNKYEKRRGLSNPTFRNRFHIHRATQRYQMEGLDIDGYAEVTERYDSFEAALAEFVASWGMEADDPMRDAPLFGDGQAGSES